MIDWIVDICRFLLYVNSEFMSDVEICIRGGRELR